MPRQYCMDAFVPCVYVCLQAPCSCSHLLRCWCAVLWGDVLQAQGRAKLGVEAFAEALLGFVKILAENSGYGCGRKQPILSELCLGAGGDSAASATLLRSSPKPMLCLFPGLISPVDLPCLLLC